MMIKKDLFLATLSLDAYNQGYDKNIVHGQTQIGSATKISDSAILDTPSNTGVAQAASFYAVAYDVPGAALVSQGNSPGDSIVISYRGTDDFSLFSPTSDIWSGWITAAGALGPQARLAAEFYHSVKAANPGKHIILTGHSLGGGLASVGWASARPTTASATYQTTDTRFATGRSGHAKP